ncbi:MAG: transcriptional regulator [Actinomycetota bacterium]|nr:transcriptional regulator [Actinomycetota bacterium]
MSHPAQDLDEVVHQRNRLAILAILSEARKVEFTYLQKSLDLTGGNLSRHLQVLEDAGLVHIEKGYEGRRPRTWVQITKAGSRALARELRTLEEIVAGLQGSLIES